MPLPAEVLATMKVDLEELEKHLQSYQGVRDDAFAAGLDVSEMDKTLADLRANYRKYKTFYELQSRRA